MDFTHHSPDRTVPTLWYMHPDNSFIILKWDHTKPLRVFLLPPSEFDDLPLSASKTDMATIVKVMQLPDSGLEIRDRMWLKITIANAVIGEKKLSKAELNLAAGLRF